MNHCTSLLDDVQEIVCRYSEDIKQSGQNFNVFSLLRKAHDEVNLHSRFITELLNPIGSHDQGSLFLDLFLEQCEIEGFKTEGCKVKPEHYIGVINKEVTTGGHIDILIESTEGQVIKIENKVYAGEQENQLLRYHHYKQEGQLIFLTLFGEESVDHQVLLKKKVDYKPLSYSKDIVKWLESCIKVCNILVLTETIRQYLNLIKQLTHQNINHKMNQDIIDLVLNNKESLEAYQALRKVENSGELYMTVMKKHIIPFIKNFAKENRLEVQGLCGSLIHNRKKWNAFSFRNVLLDKYQLKLSVNFNSDSNKEMYYGLSYCKENQENHELYDSITKELNKEMTKMKKSNENWLCHSFWIEYKDWNNIDTLYNMTYGSFQEEFTSKMLKIITVVSDLDKLS